MRSPPRAAGSCRPSGRCVVASTRPKRQSTGLPATHASHSPQRGRQSSATRSPTGRARADARTDGFDDAGTLVPHHDRQLRRQVAGHVVQVAVADPGGLDPDPDLAGPGSSSSTSSSAAAPRSARSTAALIGRPRRPSPRCSSASSGSRTAQDSNANESASASSSASSSPRNRLGVLVGQRLGDGDVEQQGAHPVEPAPRVGVEVGELAGDQVLNRLGHLGDTDPVAAPLVGRRAGSSWPRSRRTGGGRGSPGAPRPVPGDRCPCTSTASSWPGAAGRGRAGRRRIPRSRASLASSPV